MNKIQVKRSHYETIFTATNCSQRNDGSYSTENGILLKLNWDLKWWVGKIDIWRIFRTVYFRNFILIFSGSYSYNIGFYSVV